MIIKSFRVAVFCCSLVLSILGGAPAFGQANGIYADFTTSMGSFTCRLEYAIAPKATANFIGLATGQRAWLDLNNGRARTNPFYNGLIFHRVITNFVIQGGSPNGLGTDGPGYVITDEISPALRFTNSFMLAMANSGTNSNGSQFFLTVSPQPSLNNGYTIFGQLVGGTNVVRAINGVAVANDRPLTNVYIQNIGIRRVGTAAEAFNIHAQSLPIVTNVPLKIVNNASQVSLTLSNRLFANTTLYSSTNLVAWNPEDQGIEIAAPVTNIFSRLKDAPMKFYSAAQVQYPASTLAPETLLGRQLALQFNNGQGTIVITFNSSGGGTYTYSGGAPGTVMSYDWLQEPYRGRLWPVEYSGLVPMFLLLNFVNSSSGHFSGTAYPVTPVSGNWVLN